MENIIQTVCNCINNHPRSAVILRGNSKTVAGSAFCNSTCGKLTDALRNVLPSTIPVCQRVMSHHDKNSTESPCVVAPLCLFSRPSPRKYGLDHANCLVLVVDDDLISHNDIMLWEEQLKKLSFTVSLIDACECDEFHALVDPHQQQQSSISMDSLAASPRSQSTLVLRHLFTTATTDPVSLPASSLRRTALPAAGSDPTLLTVFPTTSISRTFDLRVHAVRLAEVAVRGEAVSYQPLFPTRTLADRRQHWLRLRLTPGHRLPTATSELTTLLSRTIPSAQLLPAPISFGGGAEDSSRAPQCILSLLSPWREGSFSATQLGRLGWEIVEEIRDPMHPLIPCTVTGLSLTVGTPVRHVTSGSRGIVTSFRTLSSLPWAEHRNVRWPTVLWEDGTEETVLPEQRRVFSVGTMVESYSIPLALSYSTTVSQYVRRHVNSIAGALPALTSSSARPVLVDPFQYLSHPRLLRALLTVTLLRQTHVAMVSPPPWTVLRDLIAQQ